MSQTSNGVRPQIGDSFRSHRGQVFEIAAIWPGGVVFDGGLIVTNDELLADFEPATLQPMQGVLL